MTDDVETLTDVDASDALLALVAEYPLMSGVIDGDLGQIKAGQALKLSSTSMAKYVANAVLAKDWESVDQFPVVERGGQGRPYRIRFSHAWAWLQHRKALEEEERYTEERTLLSQQAAMAGLDIEQKPDMAVDPDMRRKIAQAELLWMQTEQRRKKLVELDDMTDLLGRLMGIIRDGIESMPDRLERELGLGPEKVTMVVRLGDDILNALADAIEEAELREADIEDVEIAERLLI